MKAGYISRSVRERIRKMPKSEFNRCMQEAAAEFARNAVQIRKGVAIHTLFVDSIYNMLNVKRMFSYKRCDAGMIELGDTILFREVTADDFRQEMSGVFIIADKNISRNVFPVYADYEALDGLLHIVNLDSPRVYPKDAIVGIALASVKVSPLFDMKLTAFDR